LHLDHFLARRPICHFAGRARINCALQSRDDIRNRDAEVSGKGCLVAEQVTGNPVAVIPLNRIGSGSKCFKMPAAWRLFETGASKRLILPH
jgi:hypothetical protein